MVAASRTFPPWLPTSDDVLLRRIARSGDTNMIVFDEGDGSERVRGGAFSMDEDGCSTYCERVLEYAGLGPSGVARSPQNAVVSVTVEAVRTVQFDVHPDPWPDDSDGGIRDCAHTLITNSLPLGRRAVSRAFSTLAASARIVSRGPDGSSAGQSS